MGTILRLVSSTLFLLALQSEIVRSESPICGNRREVTKVKISSRPLSDHPLLPYHVSLVLKDRIDAICSGTIISEEFVLTSGQCVKDLRNKSLKLEAIIGFFSSSQDEEGVRIEVNEILLSPDEKLALLQLKTKITFSEKVSNICLPSPKDNFTGQPKVVPFWNYTTTTGLTFLQYAQVNTFGCQKASNGDACFKFVDRKPCLLDDGAPLISVGKNQITMIGIIPIGNICPTPRTGVSVDIKRYLQWIVDTSKIIDCKSTVGFQVKSVKFSSTIVHRLAETKAEVTVVNFSPAAREISYDFYHPESAFVTDLEITMDSYTLKGYTTKAANAKEIYQKSNRTAVLLEMSRTNDHMVTMKANVSAFQAVNFSMTYEDFLIRESETVKMLFGLSMEHNPENVKAEFSVSEFGPFNNYRFSDILDEGSKMTIKKENSGFCEKNKACRKVISFDVPITKEVQSENVTDNQLKLFTFEYKISGSLSRNLTIEDGYFVHFLPNTYFEMPQQKLVIFILDISGSMDGIKISQLKNAMITMLDSLQEKDLFQIITFNHRCSAIYPAPLAANKKNVNIATDFILKIRVMGTTNAYCALELGLSSVTRAKQHYKSSLLPIIYFLSDGAANVDLYKRSLVQSQLISTNAPVHGIAFGRDADLPFVENISNLSGGKSVKLAENKNVYLQLEQFFFDLSAPSRDDLKISMNCAGFESHVTSNRWGKMLFKETDRVIVGKQADEPIIIKFQGQPPIIIPKRDQGLKRASTCSPGMVEKLWAYLMVKDDSSLKDSLKRQICNSSIYDIDREQLALEYNLVTNLTSMIVTQDVDIYDLGNKTLETPSVIPSLYEIRSQSDEYDDDLWQMTSRDDEEKDELWFYPQTFLRGTPIKITQSTNDTSVAFGNMPNMATSFEIKGKSSWMFFSGKNFRGQTSTFKPDRYGEAEKLGSLFRNVLSVKKLHIK